MATTLEELSAQLDISPSGLRKRIHSLGLPVEKGSRGKWIIPEGLLETLREADRLMKDGAGTQTTRRVLGLTDPSLSTEAGSLTDRGSTGESPENTPGDHSLTAPSQENPELRQALELLAAERSRSEALQAQIVEVLEENGSLKSKVGMFQERSLNLADTVRKLEDKVLMLEAPKDEEKPRPWWKVWG